MARFFGSVGFNAGTVQTSPGVYDNTITERSYYGDVVRDTRRLDEVDKVNLDLSIGNSISIVADAFAHENFHAIRYVSWMGKCWIVTEVNVEHPRLILRMGGLYNGPKPSSAPESL